MKKLIEGFQQFKNQLSSDQQGHFAQLASGQQPQALLVTCCDSRIVPHQLLSAEPGDIFVVRNVGNMIPPASQSEGQIDTGVAELTAIVYATENLNVKDVIICGHSECGAMAAVLQGGSGLAWVEHAAKSKQTFEQRREKKSPELSDVNALSQINVLEQINNLKSYSSLKVKIDAGELNVHAWWFDIASATIYSYNAQQDCFEILK